MKFEEILPDMRNGKSFFRKRTDTHKSGFYFIKLEPGMIGWYDADKSGRAINLDCSLKSWDILSEDWEIFTND